MAKKLKCPFCGAELGWCLSCPMPTIICSNENCKGFSFLMPPHCWQELIQAKQDLEQSEKCCSAWETQALDYKAETIALSGKLEIATKALEEIAKEHTGTDGKLYSCSLTAHQVLEQITHDNSEKANSVEHKE